MAFSSQSFTAPSIPKLNRRTISSPLSSSASKISGVAPKLKTSRMRFFRPSLKKTNVTAEEITQKSSIENTLVETNKILVEIQKQLSLDFAMRIAEEKEKNRVLKEDKSKRRLALKESAVESTKRIGNIVKSATGKILAPVKGVFDKIMEFLSIIGTGIAANAAFEWLKDDKNKQKLQGWFNFIVEHWEWGLVALGAVAALNLVGPISALVSVLGALGSLSVPLFTFLSNPVTLTVLGTLAGLIAGTYALGKGVKWGIDKVQKATYGEGNVKKGVFITKLLDEYGRISSNKDRERMTAEEKNTATFLYQYDQMLKDRQTTNDQLFVAKEKTIGFGEVYEEGKRKRISELEEKLRSQDESIFQAETQGVKIQGKNLKELFDAYSITGALPTTSISRRPEPRAMGGPVTAGNPYIVGEKGPEFFIPNINGSVVNNYKTEKIYEMISSKNAGKINFITMDLPPQVIKKEKSIPTPPAPPVPNISSTNAADLWRVKTPDIYGIYV